MDVIEVEVDDGLWWSKTEGEVMDGMEQVSKWVEPG